MFDQLFTNMLVICVTYNNILVYHIYTGYIYLFTASKFERVT